MRFISARHDGVDFAALVEDDTAIPLVGIRELGLQTPSSVLLSAELNRSSALPIANVEIRTVIPNPDKVICVGLNYREHVAEALRDEPQYPVLFTKFTASLIGATDDIWLPAESDQVDYEGELVVVIGTAGRRIAKADALDHVAGYSIANDISMRDYQTKSHQWLQGKTWDHSTPIGPCLVTPEQLPGPDQLEITCTVNGEVRQSATTDLLIFDIPTLISEISEFTTLLPGDVIVTGTPGGVGSRRNPPTFLTDGDIVAVEIPGIGRIENHCVSEKL